MRFLLLAFLMVLGFSCQAEEQFLNPIFYQEMQSYKYPQYRERYTPTSIVNLGVGAGDSTCETIENNQTDIILLCRAKCPDAIPNYSRFINAGATLSYREREEQHGCFIFELFGDLEKITRKELDKFQTFQVFIAPFINGEEGNCGNVDEDFLRQLLIMYPDFNKRYSM